MPGIIKTLIIEDEQSAVNRLKKELKNVSNVEFEIVETTESVNDSVEWLRNNPEVDLIFTDIQLTDGLSLEIFKQVDIKTPVIFTTAYDEYALQAFKLNSIDYLLKPIDPDELANAVSKFLEKGVEEKDHYLNQLFELTQSFRPSSFRSSFLVSYRHKMMMIDVNEVAYLYVKERGVFLKKKDDQEYLVDFYLDDLEKQLDPAKFYRANRQFLVARSSIQEIEPYFNGRLILAVKPEASTSVIISKSKASDFKRWADY